MIKIALWVEINSERLFFFNYGGSETAIMIFFFFICFYLVKLDFNSTLHCKNVVNWSDIPHLNLMLKITSINSKN